MRDLQPLPTSKADNSYDLLTEVIEVIEAEPRRLFMDTWSTAFEYNWSTVLHGLELPACGTVCCVAGWINVLKVHEPTGYERWGSAAEPALRHFPESVKDDLESVFYLYPDRPDDEGVVGPQPGTPEYVSVVANALRDIQCMYERELKAYHIEPGTLEREDLDAE